MGRHVAEPQQATRRSSSRERRAADQRQTPGARIRGILIPAAIILTGLAVLLYPVIATQFNNLQHEGVAAEYAEMLQQEDPHKLDDALADAHNYNETRAQGPILDPWLSRVAEDNADYQAYLDQLNDYEAMGRLVVPSAKVDLPIYHGTTEDVLARGVGHVFGSDLPVGGKSTHSVLTSHTGLSNATLFDNLVDVQQGDAIYISVSGEKLKYVVTEIHVVLPNETDLLRKRPDQDLVTLITCTPYGVNSHRLLVTAERAPLDEAESEMLDETAGLTWQPWMVISLIAAVIVAGGTTIWGVRMARRKPAEHAEGGDTDDA